MVRHVRRPFGRLVTAAHNPAGGGTLLLIAALLALIWSNSPWASAYHDLGSTTWGPASLHLDLDLAHWAADGLLAIFFFIVGLELKREFVDGELAHPGRAAVPIIAAMAGIAVPAAIYMFFNSGGPGAHGWAIPSATDIAFAVAVLAVVGRHLPASVRVFLLTLAVVDDLLAILIIAVFYSESITLWPLLLAIVPMAVFRWLTGRGASSPWLLVPCAIVTWWLVLRSGIHPTVAGVALGFVAPLAMSRRLESAVQPISALVAVPVFAFFAAGVTVTSEVASSAASSSVTIGVIAGLVLGKPLGIVLSTWLVSRIFRGSWSATMGWLDLLGLGLLAGIGFTVSLLVGALAFGAESTLTDEATIGVLLGSLVSAIGGATILSIRNRHYRRGLERA